jgi:hypothetical protein
MKGAVRLAIAILLTLSAATSASAQCQERLDRAARLSRASIEAGAEIRLVLADRGAVSLEERSFLGVSPAFEICFQSREVTFTGRPDRHYQSLAACIDTLPWVNWRPLRFLHSGLYEVLPGGGPRKDSPTTLPLALAITEGSLRVRVLTGDSR